MLGIMSATNRGSLRHPDDYYRTPAWAVQAIIPYLPTSGIVLDPCAGDGALLEAIQAAGIESYAGYEMDVDRCAHAAHSLNRIIVCRDSLNEQPWSPAPSTVVMNPPFKLAIQFFDRAIAEVRPRHGTVACLLRVNWLAGISRRAWHQRNQTDLYVLSKRPSFTNGGTDATEYAWYVHGPGRGGRWFLV